MATKRKTTSLRKRAHRKAQKRDSNRKLILEAATDLFFERGYAGATVESICERMGVTKPYVYYYFKNKSDIFDTINLDIAAITLASFRPEAKDKRSAADKLQSGLRTFLTHHVQMFKGSALFYREEASLSPRVRTKIRNMARTFHRDLTQLLMDAIDDGVLPQQDANLTALAIGGTIGFMYFWYRPNGKRSPEEMVDRLLETVMRTAGFTIGSMSAKK